jgi:hypothetical protein
MKRIIDVVFPDLDDEIVRIELDDSLSPKTFKAILDNLPVEVGINKWGEELYTDRTTIAVEQEDNAKREVNKLDVATGLKEMHCVYFMDRLLLVRTEKYWRTLL